MGLPADEDQPPYEFDQDCNLLIPDLWPTGECPRYITALFTGVNLCPAWIGLLMNPIPNDIEIVCEQTVGDPCRWTGHYLTWDVFFDGNSFATGDSGLILIENTFFVGACWGHGPTQAATSWANILTCVGGNIGQGGSGRIF